MSDETKNKKTDSQAQTGRPDTGDTKKSVRKFAVLFTDIVGSTKFFKDRGDLVGREMLQSHQDIVTTPVIEHAGLVVKTLGDSVMAYFTDPKEALKSAIKIQQALERYNIKKDQNDQIHVRVGIHFGEGIIEDQDIFGNVVNLAAKIVSVANKDQILISQQVYEVTKNLSPVQYEKFATTSNQEELKEIPLYRVLWSDAAQFDPTANILVYLKPHWNLSDTKFAGAWNNLRTELEGSWKDRIIRKEGTKDKSLVLISPDVSSAVDLAGDSIRFIKSHLKTKVAYPLIPIQIAIDSGSFLRGEKLVMDRFNAKWDDFDPGDICISDPALLLLKNKKSVRTDPTYSPESRLSYYRLVPIDGPNEPPLFLYQAALLKGDNRPCFYCGLRKHQSQNCPSKTIDDIPFALKRIGYLSLKNINNLFYRYLTQSNSNFNSLAENGKDHNETSKLAYHAFYELKYNTQLRLLRNLWASNEDNWERVQSKKAKGTRGGQAWLALDLIRTSKLSKAEKIISSLILEQPQDYHVNCTAGLLNIELNLFNKAEYFFDQALMFAKTRPQKIFVLFLLCRLYGIQKKKPQTEAKLKEIISLYPYSPDAKYLSVQIKFQNGKKERAIAELTHLIKDSGEYYGKALIDPELGPFMDAVQPQLKKLYAEAKESAHNIMPQAEEEMKRFTDMLGDEAEKSDSLQSLWKKTRDLFKLDSYLGYLECAKSSGMIIQHCQEYVSSRRIKVEKIVGSLHKRCSGYLDYTRKFPHKKYSNPVHETLQSFQKELDQARRKVHAEAPVEVLEAINQVEKLSDRMEEIPPKLNNLETIRKSMLFLTSFFKSNLLLQSINLLIGIIFFPLIIHYLLFVFPKLDAINHNLWFYQKGFLFVGGTFALLFSLIRPLKHLPQKKA